MVTSDNRVNPLCCVATGPGLGGGMAGTPFTFTIEPRDSLGLFNNTSSSIFSARLIPKRPKVPVIDGDIVIHADGTLLVTINSFFCFNKFC